MNGRSDQRQRVVNEYPQRRPPLSQVPAPQPPARGLPTELLEKLIQRVACLEVIEEVVEGNTGAGEYQLAAHDLRIAVRDLFFHHHAIVLRPGVISVRKEESLLSETSCHTVAHVFPRFARGLTGQDTAASPLNLPRPCILNHGRVLFGVVEAGQQFRGNIGSFIDRPRQCFAEQGLRSVGHGFIVTGGPKAGSRSAIKDMMKTSYLEVTYRRGRAIAAYYYLPRCPGQHSVQTRRVEAGLLVDYARGGRPIGVEITTLGTFSVAAFNRVLRELGLPPVRRNDVAPLIAAGARSFVTAYPGDA